MNSSQKGGKSKSSRSSSSKSKKGGNFLGSASELFVPTGWESFATAAALVGIDQAAAALRRGKSEKREKSSGMKGGAPGTNLKNRHPYEILSGIRPDVDNEAIIILGNTRNLTNAFLRLYNYAYSLDSEKEKQLQLRIKLNNLLKKEIEYRKKILKLIHNEGITPSFVRSIESFIELGVNVNMDIKRFQLYYNSMHAVQPNWNKSSINETLENINRKYSNKNKYPN